MFRVLDLSGYVNCRSTPLILKVKKTGLLINMNKTEAMKFRRDLVASDTIHIEGTAATDVNASNT